MLIKRQTFISRFIKTFIFAAVLLLLTAGTVKAQALTGFTFDGFTSGSPKIAGVPFNVTITAVDGSGNRLTTFNSSVSLLNATETIYPTLTTNFLNGIWSGQVIITGASNSDRIAVSSGAIISNSATFTVVPDSRLKFLNIVSGNNQSGSVGTQLPQSLTVKVVDSYGNPIPNTGVNFATFSVPPNATNHSLSANSGISNAQGLVSSVFTLGRKAGTYLIGANLTNSFTGGVQFYETATPYSLIAITVSPSVAVMPAGSYIPFKATGHDQYLNEITLPSITWSVQNGGGTIDNTGVFYAGNTLGNFSNTVKATSGSIGATASVNIVGVWEGTAGDGDSGEGSGSGDGSGTGTDTATPSAAVPSPTPSAGQLYNVQVEPEVLSILKGARIPIVAEGVDFFGNPVAGTSFDFQVTGDLGTITRTGPNSVLLTASETGIGTVTISATQGNVTKIAKVVGSVGTGMNRRLVIEEIQSPQQVGEPFTISIAAKDSLNNFITDYKGPLILADTTGTIDPATVQPSEQGIWYVQAIISAAHPEVTVTAAGDGMIGVSNIFEVTGDPKKSDLGFGAGGVGMGGGLGDVLGASISGKIEEILNAKNLSKYAVVRYIGAGLAAGFGILGASVGGGIMASKGLEAIGRNPFAKGKLQLNLYASLVVFVAAASLAVFASIMIAK